MTAKTKHGHKAHRATHGADAGSPHHRLNRLHAMPNRAEGQPMSAARSGAAPPVVAAASGPQPSDNTMPMAPPGAGPSLGTGSPTLDDEGGDQS